jgi:hypothetical protein
MNWDELKFREPVQPQLLKPYASVNVNHRGGNSIAQVTEIDATAKRGGLYSVEFPFVTSHEALELLAAWETLMKKR